MRKIKNSNLSQEHRRRAVGGYPLPAPSRRRQGPAQAFSRAGLLFLQTKFLVLNLREIGNRACRGANLVQKVEAVFAHGLVVVIDLHMLEERIDYLGGVMNLPKLDDQDIKNGLVSIPGDGLRLAFSIVKVKRDDPAEAAFVAMLLASEEDLRGFQNEPMAFPIFGQGRALYALVGKGIRAETIDEAAQFLIGSCSCQVKEQNPGVDIAMAVDWRQMVKDQATPGQNLPELSAVADLLPQTATITAAPSDVKTNSWSLIAAALIVIGGCLWLLKSRRV